MRIVKFVQHAQNIINYDSDYCKAAQVTSFADEVNMYKLYMMRRKQLLSSLIKALSKQNQGITRWLCAGRSEASMVMKIMFWRYSTTFIDGLKTKTKFIKQLFR